MMSGQISFSSLLLSLCVWLALGGLDLANFNAADAHGGIPKVLSISPPQEENASLWMVDTLGLFKAQASEVNPSSWFWLCDDAVDPTLGVDDLVVVNEQTFIAVARSGLYRSNDSGCSFSKLDEDLNQYALGTLSLHPNRNHIVVYSDSIGRDNSVWWSEDQGQSWNQSSFSVAGTIYKLWRKPSRPMEIWINHAQGLSKSNDGGQNFELIDTQGYGLELSPNEVRLLGGGQLGEFDALFIALNRFPVASLLMSLDQGSTWRVIHQAEDSYDTLLLSSDTLWLSTPFEGLFTYPLSHAERSNLSEAWSSDNWIQNESLFISCLTPDPLFPERIWSCGRASPSDWLIAHSDDQGLSWNIKMDNYTVAAGTTWDCPENSKSLVACQARCLDETCDPSGIETAMMSMTPNPDTSTPERDPNNLATEHSGQEDQGCLQTKTMYQPPSYYLSTTFFWLIYLLSSTLFLHAKRIKK